MSSSLSPLISIIVPAYNVETYIDRCMESLVNQTHTNIEIILVDDGATDSTGLKCEEWGQKDTRIKVIHKENGGLGFARNTGLEYFSGEFVMFVDSDDFVETCMVEKMLNILLEAKADTCYCSNYVYSNKEQKVIIENPQDTGKYSGKEYLLDIVGSEPCYFEDSKREMSVWAALFSGKIIKEHSIRFKSERQYICEDLPFDMAYLQHSKSVIQMAECYYYYCVNDKSLTHKYYPDRIKKEVFLYQYIDAGLKKIFQDEKLYKDRYDRLFLGRVRNCIIQEVNDSGLSSAEIKKNIKKIVNNEVVRMVIDEYSFNKNPIKQKMFNYCLKYRLICMIVLMVRLKS